VIAEELVVALPFVSSSVMVNGFLVEVDAVAVKGREVMTNFVGGPAVTLKVCELEVKPSPTASMTTDPATFPVNVTLATLLVKVVVPVRPVTDPVPLVWLNVTAPL
jgi:hypothetical protein